MSGGIQNGAYDTAATTNTHWATNVSDGMGRTLTTLTGYTGSPSNTVVSTVDKVYGPCACSPTAKPIQTSQPYAPGGSDLWTVYTYDGLGRTTAVTLPDASVSKMIY